jgi:putative heme iron utilization protein
MLSIDNEAMYLDINDSNDNPLKIEFDHNLKDAKDAHHTLVSMLQEAKKNS